MIIHHIINGIIGVALATYLFYALLRPEKL